MPAPVLIRAARPSDVKTIARIHVDGWRAAYSSFMSDSVLSALRYEEDSRSFREWLFHSPPPPICQVAVSEGTVIGFVIASPNKDETTRPYDAEIHKLFVRPEYQGQSIGRRLLHAACFELLQRGHQSVILWAFSAARSVGFYQSLGGEVVHRICEQVGDQKLDVLVFGWAIRDLLNKTSP